ncbi:uncharacterized protein B0I36DRAFT_387769 [Microdochium trichocladiopsis]|uniref:Phytanoyl-CoA dioxygenase n=1 Tax=Microdochium trichocladiopsis TaxID=1682393 RepID=A0A9P8XW05_9PEZI|nr:uncharacterized protein B0I36DRAFT_387769 [Microdochium trichocladiopsis]KAH7020962.1 hypothetical protein B0I36DRAFT_387769 [Microdochium trichocladiopsis]
MADSRPGHIPSPAALRASLRRDGFVIIRSILPPAQLAALHAAARRTTALARAGGWPHVRTVGKQFPPWTFDPEAGIWGVQGLMDPALGPESRVFARGYFSDEILGVVKALLGSDDDDDDDNDDDSLVLELYNLLVNPPTPFALRWHRDDIPATATTEEEEARLLHNRTPSSSSRQQQQQPLYSHTQYNLALCDADASLVVVPGSHARARTQAERDADPFAEHLPGQLVVQLGAGDVVFYDNNILHRGVYEDVARERMALHGSVGHVRAGKARARNVLQHGVRDWVEGVDFDEVFAAGLAGGDEASDAWYDQLQGEAERKAWKERQKARAEKMREKLVKLGRESGDVGYSLTG